MKRLLALLLIIFSLSFNAYSNILLKDKTLNFNKNPNYTDGHFCMFNPGNNTDNGYWYTYSTEEGCKDRLIPNKAAYIVTKHWKKFILFKQLHWKYFNYFENRPTSKIKPIKLKGYVINWIKNEGTKYNPNSILK